MFQKIAYNYVINISFISSFYKNIFICIEWLCMPLAKGQVDREIFTSLGIIIIAKVLLHAVIIAI